MFFDAPTATHWYSDNTNIRLLRVAMYPLAALVAAISGWWYRHMQKVALAWPSVEGCIQFADAAPDKNGSNYNVTVQYTYFVGEYQSGSFIRVFSSGDEAENYARAVNDKKIQVRYNPSNPKKCVVEEEDIDALLPVTDQTGLFQEASSGDPA